jgi:hypothetical protein
MMSGLINDWERLLWFLNREMDHAGSHRRNKKSSSCVDYLVGTFIYIERRFQYHALI